MIPRRPTSLAPVRPSSDPEEGRALTARVALEAEEVRRALVQLAARYDAGVRPSTVDLDAVLVSARALHRHVDELRGLATSDVPLPHAVAAREAVALASSAVGDVSARLRAA